MLREETLVNERSTACHGVNLDFDLNQKMLKFLVFSFNSSLYLSVFVLEPLLMYFSYCSISMNFPCLWKGVVSVVKMSICLDSVRIFYILSVIVQSYVKRGFQLLSDMLYLAE